MRRPERAGPGIAVLVIAALAACGDATSTGDYDAAAVVRGSVRTGADDPVVGATIEVDVFLRSCTTTPIATSGDGVRTDANGAFQGQFSFLSTGPVTALCTELRVLEGDGSVRLADTLIARPVRFDARASDTVTVELTAVTLDIPPQ